MPFLTRGNAKLGKDIWTFSLPSVDTCPGASALCKSVCYAARYEKRWKSTRRKYELNLATFNVTDMVAEIKKVKPKVVRIHVSGDFYSVEYAEQWLEIVRSCPEVTFYAYTRSWAIGGKRDSILYVLSQMEDEDNCTILWSVDPSMVGASKVDVSPLFNGGANINRRVALLTPHGYSWGINASTGLLSWKPSKKLRVVDCPEMTGKSDSCSTCQLCFHRTLRKRHDIVINFPQH